MEKEKLIKIVTQAQAGDPAALESLFSEFYNDVYYFALKTVKDSDTACDVTQETFLEIIRSIRNLKEPAAFVTWMKQITYHQCVRYFKKNREVLVDEDEDGNTVFDTLADESEGSIPSEVLEQEEFRRTILEMIDKLTEEQRSAVMMYYFDELSVKQIAQIQGVSEGTVKSRLNYARKAVRKSVEEYEKKTGIKLHSFSFLPLFMLFFGKVFMPAQKVEQVQTVVMKTVTGGAAASGAAAAGGAAAKPLLAKIVAGVLAVALVGGGMAAAISLINDSEEDPSQQIQVEEQSPEMEPQPQQTQPPRQDPGYSSVLSMEGSCRRNKDVFDGYLENLENYILTKDGKLLDTLFSDEEVITQNTPQQWTSLGSYPAYYDAEGQLYMVTALEEYSCAGVEGQILCASYQSLGPVDDYLSNLLWVHSVDAQGNPCWSQSVVAVQPEHFYTPPQTYHNQATSLVEESTGQQIWQVDDAARVGAPDSTTVIRYVAGGKIYETEPWQWELVVGKPISVRDTGIAADALLSDLGDPEMIYRDPAQNVIFIHDQPVAMPEGKTIGQITGAYSGFTSVIVFDDDTVYLHGDAEDPEALVYNEELTALYREGKIRSIFVSNWHGHVLFEMDDGLVYLIFN